MIQQLILFSFLLLFAMPTLSQKILVQEPLKYLALGDSYTIGESVSPNERWSAQLVDSLKVKGIREASLRIIATTGWRTDDLMNAIQKANITEKYNLVSLLIGVNNQYQGRPIDVYKIEFEQLLKKAIELADGKKENVFVVSIPDYAYTPFGQQRPNNEQISIQLDAFNEANKTITEKYGIVYFNITPISRQGLSVPSLVANDALHPSGKMYSEWVKLMLPSFQVDLTTSLEDNLPELPTVYPNPTNDAITLEVPMAEQNRVKIFLVDENGMVLYYQEIFAIPATSLSMKNLPNGIYFYLIESHSKRMKGKIIKK
jgi:lysophospholipase L1-like esterase